MALLTNINGKFSVSDAGAVTFNNAFTFPTADGAANYVLQTNGSGQIAWAENGNGDISGSGDSNYVTKFTGAKTIGNGPITFSGTGSVNSTFAGTIASNNIAITNSGNGELSVTRTSGATVKSIAQSARGQIGTTSNHELQLITNATSRLTISTSGAATFAGSITSQGIDATSLTTPLIQLQGDLNVLNKAQTAYITLADRDTSGSEVVYNLSNLGSATFAGTIAVADLPGNATSTSVLVKNETIGPELLSNGDFTGNPDLWSGDESITNGQLTKTAGGLAYQSITLTDGATYYVTVDVASISGTPLIYAAGSQSSGLSAGLNELYLVAGGSNTLFGINNGSGSVFNSISLKLVTSASDQVQTRQLGSGGFGDELWAVTPTDSNDIYNLNSANVGIGTASPTNPLSVEATNVSDWVAEFKQGHSTAGQSYGVNIFGGTSSSDAAFQVCNQAGSGLLRVTGAGEITNTMSGGKVLTDTNGFITSFQTLDTATAGGRYMGKSNRGLLGQIRIEQTATGADGGYISFDTSPSGSTTPTQKMRVNSSGSVGIGFTDPGNYKLKVNGAISGTNIYANSAGGSFVFGASTSEGEYITRPNATSDICIIAGGNVGINTTSPDATLELYNISQTSDGDGSATETLSGQDSLLLQAAGGGVDKTTGSITWRSGSRRRAMITSVQENADGDYQGIAFYTRGTDGPGDMFESMRISHSGNVIQSGTSPQYQFVTPSNYNFQIAVQENVSNALEITPSTAAGGTTFSTPAVIINSSGNVGIGVTGPSRKFQIDQTSTTAGGAYVYSNAIHTGTSTNSLVSIRQDNASATGTVLDVRGDGTGNKLIVWDTTNVSLIVKDGGNVGIGTDSPGRKLTVTGDVSGDANNLLLSNENDTNGDSASIGFSMLSNNSYVKAGIFFQRITTQGRGDLIFANNNEVNGNNVGVANEIMSIRNTGAIEIKGTSTTLNGKAFITNTDALMTIGSTQSSGVPKDMAFFNGGERMRIQATTGNVGIGTTLPAAGLDIKHATAPLITRSTNNNAIAMYNEISGGYSHLYLYQINAGARVVISTNGNSYFNGGNVGIGNTSPDAKLEVTGTTLLKTSAGVGDVYLGNIISASAPGNGLRMHSNNSIGVFDFKGPGENILWRQYEQSNNGNINNKFGMKMDTGAFTASGDVVAFGSPSDKRLKENIKPIESALDKISKLQGVTFDWKKSDSILDIKQDIGFIAQDVQKVIPELVRENENGMLSMRHQGVTPILLEAIKELKAEIEELKSKSCNCK